MFFLLYKYNNEPPIIKYKLSPMKIKPIPEGSSISVHGITSLFSAGVNFSAFFCLCLASRTTSDPLRFRPIDKPVTRVIIV